MTLMIDPPGTGKTMLARRLPTIMPPLSLEESLETTRIYWAAGELERACEAELPCRACWPRLLSKPCLSSAAAAGPQSLQLARMVS